MENRQLVLNQKSIDKDRLFEQLFILALEKFCGNVTIIKELNHVDGRTACLRVYQVQRNGRMIRFRVYENENRNETELKIGGGLIESMVDELRKPDSICLGNKYFPRCIHVMGDKDEVDCWEETAGLRKKKCGRYQSCTSAKLPNMPL
jgi:hypothetical protein